MSRQGIKDYADQAQVPFLVHFTQAPNLPSIFQHGIVPRVRCGELRVQPIVNDAHRLDGRLTANCTSIGFPNSPMFYKFRRANQNSEWAVLLLDRSILWEKQCAFCRHNAADNRISARPLQDLMTPAALVGMYEEIEGFESRVNQQLMSYDPTDVQAEVLVFDVIEPALIQAIAFDNQRVKAQYEHLAAGKHVRIYGSNRGPFAGRSSAYTDGF